MWSCIDSYFTILERAKLYKKVLFLYFFVLVAITLILSGIKDSNFTI